VLLRSTLLLALVLGAAACGGDDDGPTESEFRETANAVCVRANAALMRMPLPETEDEARDSGAEFERAREARWKALRDEVEAPESLRARFDRAVERRDWSGLGDLGLDRCATEGVAAFAGGAAWAKRVEPACVRLLGAMTRETTLTPAEWTTSFADGLRRIARRFGASGPPREAAPAAQAAMRSMRSAARFLERVVAGRATFDPLDPDPSIVRGEAALNLLDVGECGDLYPVLMDE